MNKTLVVFVWSLLLTSFSSFSQANKDTSVILYNWKWEKATRSKLTYIGLRWQENGKLWIRKDYSYPELDLLQIGKYSDSSCSEPIEPVVKFQPTTKANSNYLIAMNNYILLNLSTIEDEKTSNKLGFKNGVLIDSNFSFFKNGKVHKLIISDSRANKYYNAYSQNDIIRIKGQFYQGKKEGVWTYTDSNNIVSQVVNYLSDSAVSVTNYDEKGKKAKGENVVEKPASYKGGIDNWKRFLERNLQYPEMSRIKGVHGIARVSLTIDKNGKVTDVKLLNAPDEFTGKEAQRLIESSPDWIAATQYNRPVTYRFVQTLTFALQ